MTNSKAKRVAIQGITGSFHEIVAHRYFGKEIEVIDCETFKSVCEVLENGQSDYAVMAIENTIAGTLLQNYSLLREHHLKIIGEEYLHIQMHLMALPGTKIENLEFIYSHPIAINQCLDYLETLTHTKVIAKNDTAYCAKMVREENLTHAGAIAGIQAAEMYQLEILEKNIQTYKQNYTRFFILSKTLQTDLESNKSSLCFELGHTPGALATALQIFANYGLNLTKIQSIPLLGKPYEYAFYVDVEWEIDAKYKNAIQDLLRCVSNLSVVGEYKKGDFLIKRTF